MPKRCEWVEGQFDEYIEYHDKEWGIPVYDDSKHFEFIILESAQAGLSWSTILKKRKGYRNAFQQFNPEAVASFDEKEMESLLRNKNIIRNKLKIKAAIENARIFLKIQKEFESFSQYIWSFVDNKPKINNWRSLAEVPSKTPESEKLSKDLKKRGFQFFGPTIAYAHMQAVGLVCDHTTDCFRYKELCL